MASNAELSAQIKVLDPNAVTEGLNNARLTEKLSELEKLAETPPDSADETPPTPGVDAEAEKAKVEADAAKAKADAEAEKAKEKGKKYPYAVAKGKSITTKQGVIGPGDEIKAEWLPMGKDALDQLVKSKYVIKS